MSNIFKIILSLTLVLTVLGCKEQPKKVSVSEQEKKVIELVSSVELYSKLQDGIQLVDVRTTEEYENGFIEGAVNMDIKDSNFNLEVLHLDKDKPVYVYCKRGGRSAKSAKRLQSLGFTKVYDLQGGITAWKDHGFKIVHE